MAGNCDMGGGNHKCCDTAVNHSAPTAAVLHSGSTHAAALPVVVAHVHIEVAHPRPGQAFDFTLMALSNSPPGYSAILRI